jgi:putative phosphoribosyl transferase
MAALQFADRLEAGRLLAKRLASYANKADAVVLALPRGGVEVGFELAQRLSLPLDIIGVRKLGVPGHEELAFGAVASGGARVIDTDIVEAFELSTETIDRVAAAEQRELERRESAFRVGSGPLKLQGQLVILVDDGIATGSTMRSAVAAVRQMGAEHIVVAAGVAPATVARELAAQADEVVCLHTPHDFRAVSIFYTSFPQLTDENVRNFLQRAAQGAVPPPE